MPDTRASKSYAPGDIDRLARDIAATKAAAARAASPLQVNRVGFPGSPIRHLLAEGIEFPGKNSF
jgi:hypothetical protein